MATNHLPLPFRLVTFKNLDGKWNHTQTHSFDQAFDIEPDESPAVLRRFCNEALSRIQSYLHALNDKSNGDLRNMPGFAWYVKSVQIDRKDTNGTLSDKEFSVVFALVRKEKAFAMARGIGIGPVEATDAAAGDGKPPSYSGIK